MSSLCYQLEDTAGICSPPLASPAGGQEQKTIAQMFEDVSHGLPPAISTLMFQSSLQSVKELAKVLVEFFKHGLSTNKVTIVFLKLPIHKLPCSPAGGIDGSCPTVQLPP